MSSFTKSLFVAALCLGCVTLVAAEKAAVKVELRRAETEPAEGLTEAAVDGKKIYLHKEAEITGADVASARPTEDTTGKPAVAIALTTEGGKKMRLLTEKHLNKPLAILIDGKVISAPVVKAVIGEQIWITGTFTKEEVEKLANSIKAK